MTNGKAEQAFPFVIFGPLLPRYPLGAEKADEPATQVV
jgi:hypothetical protein